VVQGPAGLAWRSIAGASPPAGPTPMSLLTWLPSLSPPLRAHGWSSDRNRLFVGGHGRSSGRLHSYPLPCCSGDGCVAAAATTTGLPAAALAVTRRPAEVGCSRPMPCRPREDHAGRIFRAGPWGPPLARWSSSLAKKLAGERYYRKSSQSSGTGSAGASPGQMLQRPKGHGVGSCCSYMGATYTSKSCSFYKPRA
jgi:hypothetical protein